MAVTVRSWASMTPATNCWPPIRALAAGRGGVVAVAVVSVRVVRAAAGVRDLDAVRVLRGVTDAYVSAARALLK